MARPPVVVTRANLRGFFFAAGPFTTSSMANFYQVVGAFAGVGVPDGCPQRTTARAPRCGMAVEYRRFNGVGVRFGMVSSVTYIDGRLWSTAKLGRLFFLWCASR